MIRPERNWLGFGLSAALSAVALLVMVGCADDLYAPCDLDENSPDEAVRACGSDDGSSEKSCAVENQIQCDTRVCGRYNGSEPFCTKRCNDDSDCPTGICTEFVFQSGVKYCVEESNL